MKHHNKPYSTTESKNLSMYKIKDSLQTVNIQPMSDVKSTVLLIVSLTTETVMITLLHRTCGVHFVLQFNLPHSTEVSKYQPSASKQTLYLLKNFLNIWQSPCLLSIYNFFLSTVHHANNVNCSHECYPVVSPTSNTVITLMQI